MMPLAAQMTRRTTACARALRGALRRVLGYPLLRNVQRAPPESGRPRCLFVYLTRPFQLPDGHPLFLAHQNLRQARIIASALTEVGYEVDVADVRGVARLPRAAYDLILTHHPRLESIARGCSPLTRVVYLATGMEHATHNRLVRQRLEAIAQRRGCRLPPFAINDESLTVLPRASAIVGFGSTYTLGTWSAAFAGPLIAFDNFGFPSIAPPAETAPEARRHFLFFGGANQVLKGLDLLLEVFACLPDVHLHVAGLYAREPAFCACYQRELHETPNIHAHGWVEVGSPTWQMLVRQCAYVVLPSCTEGQAGSVLQAMHAGLVPVVTRATGIETGDFGLPLEDEPLPGLPTLVQRLAALPEAEVRARRTRTLATARARYREAAFEARWRQIASSLAGLPPVSDKGR